MCPLTLGAAHESVIMEFTGLSHLVYVGYGMALLRLRY